LGRRRVSRTESHRRPRQLFSAGTVRRILSAAIAVSTAWTVCARAKPLTPTDPHRPLRASLVPGERLLSSSFFRPAGEAPSISSAALRPLGHPPVADKSVTFDALPTHSRSHSGQGGLAEGRGFEPPRDLRPYPISSRTPSTGLGHPSASTRAVFSIQKTRAAAPRSRRPAPRPSPRRGG
jgi:hypothetical protein